MYQIFLFLKADRSLAIGTSHPEDCPWEALAIDVPQAQIRSRIMFAAIEQADLANSSVQVLYPDGCTTIVRPKPRLASVS